MFNQLIQESSHSPAIWTKESYITYKELSCKIKDLATSFLKQGIQKGDRVAFIAETHLPSILAFFALLEIEASPCLLSTRLPKEQLSFYLKQARASFVLNTKSLSLERTENSLFFKESEILLFTSGSSNTPKLASLHWSQFLANAKGSVNHFNLNSGEGCWLLSVPLFHVSGLSILFRCFSTDSSIAFSENLLEGHLFTTHLSLVPTQLLRIAQNNTPFPKLSSALIGGAPISETLVKLSLEKKIPLLLTYGMTEMASQITMTKFSDSLLPIQLGKPLPYREISLGPDGEILVKGDCLFNGYDSSLGLLKPMLEGGWFQTGDLGFLNLENNLEYRGRKDNLFISGGENIYPEEIERALGSIHGVLEALVVPIEDPEFGQRPVAFINTKQIIFSKEEFHEKLSPLLPRFCLPIHFFPFPKLEENKNFKRKRSDLTKWLKTIDL